jgi:PAS domain S-box-containing protein
MDRAILRQLIPYGIAAGVVFGATAVRLLFNPWINPQVPFLTYYLAVMVASWWGGLGPGLMAAALCTVLGNYLFMPPPYQLVPDSATMLALAVFVLEAASIAMISERWKATATTLKAREAELRRSLDALHRSEEDFRTISEAAPALVWVCDADGRNLFVNDSWCKYTGQSRDQAQGHGWLQAIHEDDRTGLSLFGERFRTGGDSYEGECRYRGRDGCYHWHAFRALPRLGPQGRIEAWYGVSIDITARKEAEEQLQRWTSELERAVASRTHSLMQSEERLRALTTELNLTEQRERKRLATELHDHLAQMLVLGRLKLGQARQLGDVKGRMADLLAETDEALSESLTYTRTLVADLTPPVLHQFGLPAALRWLSERMRRLDLAVTVEADDGQDFALPEDQAILLFQSARELLMNIAKHAGCSEAVLRLSRDDRELRLDVIDAGRGFNFAASDAASAAGAKFGLFSIRERMKALGGRFEIQSAVGSGTKATLMLPLPAGTAPPPQSPEVGLAASPSGPSVARDTLCRSPSEQGVSRILLVDDHVMVRQGLRSLLESYPDVAVVGEASTGEEAVASVAALMPAIVVMDINMPRMNGVEATKQIKERYPHVVVIGLSVTPDGNNHQLMKQAGAHATLTKEAAVEHLYSAIQGAMHGQPHCP